MCLFLVELIPSNLFTFLYVPTAGLFQSCCACCSLKRLSCRRSTALELQVCWGEASCQACPISSMASSFYFLSTSFSYQASGMSSERGRWLSLYFEHLADEHQMWRAALQAWQLEERFRTVGEKLRGEVRIWSSRRKSEGNTWWWWLCARPE